MLSMGDVSVKYSTPPLCLGRQLHASTISVELLCVQSGEWPQCLGHRFALVFMAYVFANSLSASRCIHATRGFYVYFRSAKARRVRVHNLFLLKTLIDDASWGRKFLGVCEPNGEAQRRDGN